VLRVKGRRMSVRRKCKNIDTQSFSMQVVPSLQRGPGCSAGAASHEVMQPCGIEKIAGHPLARRCLLESFSCYSTQPTQPLYLQITRARKTSTRNMFLTLIAESDVAHFGQDRERRKREGKERIYYGLKRMLALELARTAKFEEHGEKT
jgi:hypothetical protein